MPERPQSPACEGLRTARGTRPAAPGASASSPVVAAALPETSPVPGPQRPAAARRGLTAHRHGACRTHRPHLRDRARKTSVRGDEGLTRPEQPGRRPRAPDSPGSAGNGETAPLSLAHRGGRRLPPSERHPPAPPFSQQCRLAVAHRRRACFSPLHPGPTRPQARGAAQPGLPGASSVHAPAPGPGPRPTAHRLGGSGPRGAAVHKSHGPPQPAEPGARGPPVLLCSCTPGPRANWNDCLKPLSFVIVVTQQQGAATHTGWGDVGCSCQGRMPQGARHDG